MKSRIFPVVVTAAATSLATLFVAGRFQDQIPFLHTSSESHQLPVNYSFTGEGDATTVRSAPPIDFQPAAEGAVKAVVHIKTATKATLRTVRDPFAEFFGIEQNQIQRIPPQIGSGSGVVVSPDGYIVTNNHVVAGADQVTVTFNDRFTTTAKVVGTDPSTDIAVIKVNEKNLSFMEFGNSDDVKLGQWVLAVGYPLTLDATVTAGIVSAKSRAIGINRTQSNSAIESFIQTDAAVNPGNSGGALVNTNGQLIGINSAIASPTGSYAGYSYAVPANIVRKVANDLMQYGTVQRAVLGIEFPNRKQMSQEQLKEYGIDRNEGVYVANALENGGAFKSGIRKGDFVVAINNVPVRTEPELQEQIARYKPGDNISVTYLRNGNKQVTSVQLRNMQGTTAIVKGQSAQGLLGANVRDLTTDEKNSLRLRGGVMVTDIGEGPIANQTNMRKSFIILSVNDQDVSNAAQLQRLVASSSSIKVGGIYPGYQGMYYYGVNTSNGDTANN